jgi:hypothetical protein
MRRNEMEANKMLLVRTDQEIEAVASAMFANDLDGNFEQGVIAFYEWLTGGTEDAPELPELPALPKVAEVVGVAS